MSVLHDVLDVLNAVIGFLMLAAIGAATSRVCKWLVTLGKWLCERPWCKATRARRAAIMTLRVSLQVLMYAAIGLVIFVLLIPLDLAILRHMRVVALRHIEAAK